MATNAFEFFMGRQNARVVHLLERNHNVSGALQGILEHMVSVADAEGVPFEDVSLEDVFVSGRHLQGRILIRR